MKVRQKYSTISEQMLYEWTLLTPTVYNRHKTAAHIFWQSIKNEEFSSLKFIQVVKLEKLVDSHYQELKPKRY